MAARGEPVGAREEPVGAREEPVGAREEPVGAREEPVGAREEPVGAREEPVAAREPNGVADGTAGPGTTEAAGTGNGNTVTEPAYGQPTRRRGGLAGLFSRR
jgi:hypothetical protein